MSENVKFLSALFENHGLPCGIENDWVIPNSQLPALRARWFPPEPGKLFGVLSVEALLDGGILIEECFGGFDENDGLANFTRNSFHVLLAALWGKNDPEQVRTEQWLVNKKNYTAYIGNFGTRAFKGSVVNIPDDLFSSIEKAIRLEPLSKNIHWFRLYCNISSKNDFIFEALKDNKPWENGMNCLKNISWKVNDRFYSIRLFILLQIAPQPALNGLAQAEVAKRHGEIPKPVQDE